MGLGKTVQVIALLVFLVEQRGNPGPFLIAAPSSVLPNWVSELRRWAPSLRLVDYRGSAETRERIWMEQVGVGRVGDGGRGGWVGRDLEGDAVWLAPLRHHLEMPDLLALAWQMQLAVCRTGGRPGEGPGWAGWGGSACTVGYGAKPYRAPAAAAAVPCATRRVERSRGLSRLLHVGPMSGIALLLLFVFLTN
jgi:hypothetical protein